MKTTVELDFKNNTFRFIQVDQTSLGMPGRDYLIEGLDEPEIQAYYKAMVESAKLLGADEETAKSELLEALKFEIALAELSLSEEESGDLDKSYNKFTVKNLQEMVPQIPWLKYFNGLVEDKIYENETILVAVPEFVEGLGKLIAQTEKRVISNYMLWRVVFESMSALSEEWRNLLFEYNSVVTGTESEKPRWEQCLSAIKEASLLTAISSPYVKYYFDHENKEKVLELVKYLLQEFLDILDKNEWMDEETKKNAEAKAKAILYFIGYPDELLNNTAILEIYENLTITTDRYFDNIRRSTKWSVDGGYSELRKPNFRGDWEMHTESATVNAYYYMEENSIEFPAGILQKIFFNKDRPSYLNFAAIGHIIGHEITHGFDDLGRQYDKDGNKINWWDKATDEHFLKKSQCFIDQYSNYTAENGMKLDGENTLGENIADNGGLKEAYLAYNSWVKDNGPEPLLPGVNYTQNQLFWISAASTYCTRVRPKYLKLQILSDSHSPDKFRVLGPMSNLEEFSADFNCPPDSPMNKKPKCEVW